MHIARNHANQLDFRQPSCVTFYHKYHIIIQNVYIYLTAARVTALHKAVTMSTHTIHATANLAIYSNWSTHILKASILKFSRSS